ncbi:MAG: MarR family transcriptional regulator [Microbacterium sp.]|nr:MAG: MarR family transcriptional regulator [Microbacterium sp.]
MTAPGPRLALLLLGSYRKLVNAAVAELAAQGYADVRPSLHYAMSAIDLGAGTASELGRALSVTKQAASKTITLLEGRGWVALRDDAADRRRKQIVVTELGHDVMRAGESIFDELRQTWSDRVGSDVLRDLEEQLAAFVGEESIRLDAPGWISTSEEPSAMP